MSAVNGVVESKTVAKSGVTLMARVVGAGGTPITQASIGSISYAVQDVTEGTRVASGSISVAGTVYDSLQPWAEDANGYNFAWTTPASSTAYTPANVPFIQPHQFQVDVQFTPVSGEPFIVPFVLWAHPVWI